MSRPRYGWWGYVKDMIRRYYVGNTTENVKSAVREAVHATEQLPNGEDRLKIIDAVLWRETHTLSGAAKMIPCGYETAKRYQQQFIKEVAKNFRCDGLIE